MKTEALNTIDLTSYRKAKTKKQKATQAAYILWALDYLKKTAKDCEADLRDYLGNEPGDYDIDGLLVSIGFRQGHVAYKDSKELLMTYVPPKVLEEKSYVTKDAYPLKVRKGAKK